LVEHAGARPGPRLFASAICGHARKFPGGVWCGGAVVPPSSSSSGLQLTRARGGAPEPGRCCGPVHRAGAARGMDLLRGGGRRRAGGGPSYQQAAACLRLPGLQEAGIRFRAGNCRPDRGAPIQRQRPAARTATGLPCHYQTTAGAAHPGPARPPLSVRPATDGLSIGDLSSLLLVAATIRATTSQVSPIDRPGPSKFQEMRVLVHKCIDPARVASMHVLL
jgi:hypothetical protein